MPSEVIASNRTYAGLFMVTLATLMYEILLTRIFSVTMYYHFVFMAVSIVMFGLTVGGLLVYLFPTYFTQEKAKEHLANTSLLFALAIVASFLTYLNIRFITGFSLWAALSMASIYAVASIPFVFSGITVCLALTKFPRQVSQLYAVDLAGAATGCILVIYTLRITDGPTAVVVAALLAAIGASFFAGGGGSPRLKPLARIATLSLAGFAVANALLVRGRAPLMRVSWAKGVMEPPPLYEKWNSFSRVTVSGDPNKMEVPFGWGLSSLYPSDRRVRQLHMLIDSGAATVLTAFDGNFDKLEHLKYDVTNVAHYLRPNSKVLVIGAGGGRDVLSALAFRQKSVLAIEMNQDIIKAINRTFGNFTGHLDRDPRVIFVNDEARSYLARQREKVDIIQVSLIDTWAATATGAFALTENSLYTVEAWRLFLERLNPSGVLTFSRWYIKDRPTEVYRLVSLATVALKQLGVETPRDRIILVSYMRRHIARDEPDGVGTILVSKEPFSDRDLAVVEKLPSQMRFEVVLSPRVALDSNLAAIASGKDLDRFMATFPMRIAPPTDDSPFFFYMFRLGDVFHRLLWGQGLILSTYMGVLIVLGALFLTVVGLTFLCVIVPLVLTTRKGSLAGALPLFIFFAGIGLGYMLVEVSQMQRLMIFLGHPTYALSVVLFALLLSSGLGSYSTGMIGNPELTQRTIAPLLLLLGVLILFGLLTPSAINAFDESRTMVRISISTASLVPLGFFMGMAFPLGMKLASARSASLTPWLWGLNGATSVCASVLAFAIALSSGISTAFWTGFWCYAVALVAFVWAIRGKRS